MIWDYRGWGPRTAVAKIQGDLTDLDQELRDVRILTDNFWTMAAVDNAFAIEYLQIVAEDVLVQALQRVDDETLQKLNRALRRVNQLDAE